MEGQHIYEGVIKTDPNTGKIFLVGKSTVVDINFILAKEVNEKVKIIVAKAEDI